jgi:hypothetical protein
MRINRAALAVVLAAALSPAGLDAQKLTRVAMDGTPFYVMDMEVLDAQPFTSKTEVRNAPFSADAVTEFVQVLADGNRIERRFSSAIARDSQGRTRREQEVALLGPLAPLQSEPPNLVTITDPVTGVNYTLDARLKVAHRSDIGIKQIVELTKIETTKIATTKLEKAKLIDRQALLGTTPKTVAKASTSQLYVGGSGVSTEQLGTRQIEGVAAEGTRTTMTIPAGEIGNIGPIEVVIERWFSKELQEAVLITRRDPRSGDTTYRLTNIVRREPPPDLFMVPADYETRYAKSYFKKVENAKMLDAAARKLEAKRREGGVK